MASQRTSGHFPDGGDDYVRPTQGHRGTTKLDNAHAKGGARRILIRLGVAAGLLALVWASFVSHRNFWEFVNATEQQYHANRVLRAAQHLIILIQRAEIGVRGFHITGQDHSSHRSIARKEIFRLRSIISAPSPPRQRNSEVGSKRSNRWLIRGWRCAGVR